MSAADTTANCIKSKTTSINICAQFRRIPILDLLIINKKQTHNISKYTDDMHSNKEHVELRTKDPDFRLLKKRYYFI